MIRTHVLDNGATVLIDEMRDVRSFALGVFVARGLRATSRPRGRACPTSSSTCSSSARGGGPTPRSRARSTASAATSTRSRPRSTPASTSTRSTTRFDEALDLVGDVVLAPAFNAVGHRDRAGRHPRGDRRGQRQSRRSRPRDLRPVVLEDAPARRADPRHRATRSARSRGATSTRYYGSRYSPAQPHRVGRGPRRGADGRSTRSSGSSRRPRGRAPAAPESETARPRAHAASWSCARRKGLDQVHVCLGVEAPAQTSRRRYAAALLDVVLGGGMSSRLFQEVREKRGLAYSIGSSLNAYRLGGYETISAACAPRNLPRLIEVTLRELAQAQARRRREPGSSPGEGEPEERADPGSGVDGLTDVLGGPPAVLPRPRRAAGGAASRRSRR